MRNWLSISLLGVLLLLSTGATLTAQPAEKTEPAKYERDNSTTVVPYTLAAIASIVVMVLVCMPVRRE